jgi:hypothetical protein
MQSWGRSAALAILVVSAACSRGPRSAQPAAASTPPTQALASREAEVPKVELPAYSAAKAFEHLQYLAGTVGVRSAGSPGDEKGAQYIAEKLKSCGLDTRVETFPIPVWHEKKASLTIEGAKPVVLEARPVAFTRVTSVKGITGDFVDLFDANPRQRPAGI